MIWVNHQLVHQNDQERGLEQGQDIVEVNFKKGWNRILMKLRREKVSGVRRCRFPI